MQNQSSALLLQPEIQQPGSPAAPRGKAAAATRVLLLSSKSLVLARHTSDSLEFSCVWECPLWAIVQLRQLESWCELSCGLLLKQKGRTAIDPSSGPIVLESSASSMSNMHRQLKKLRPWAYLGDTAHGVGLELEEMMQDFVLLYNTQGPTNTTRGCTRKGCLPTQNKQPRGCLARTPRRHRPPKSSPISDNHTTMSPSSPAARSPSSPAISPSSLLDETSSGNNDVSLGGDLATGQHSSAVQPMRARKDCVIS